MRGVLFTVLIHVITYATRILFSRTRSGVPTLTAPLEFLVTRRNIFHACVSGCGFKFDVPEKTVEECQPNRPKPPLPPPTAKKTTRRAFGYSSALR
ncbi:hypothetical protein AKJ16_DCAP11583 [Drosera capensis]